MIWILPYGVVAILSFLYAAYLIEIYRHMNKPLKPISHEKKEHKLGRFLFLFIGIIVTITLAFIIRQFLLPRPVFNLIVASLQAIFTIPFFGALVTDHLLRAGQQKRLPRPITLLILIGTAIVAITSNALLLFASQNTIQRAADIMEMASDIITVCFIIIMGYLGIQYFKSVEK